MTKHAPFTDLTDDDLCTVSGGGKLGDVIDAARSAKGLYDTFGDIKEVVMTPFTAYGIYSRDAGLRADRDAAYSAGTTESMLRGDMLNAEHQTGLGGALLGSAVGLEYGVVKGGISGSVFGPEGSAIGALGYGLVKSVDFADQGQQLGIFYAAHFSEKGALYHGAGLTPQDNDATANFKLLSTPDGYRPEIKASELPLEYGEKIAKVDEYLHAAGIDSNLADTGVLKGGAYDAAKGGQIVFDRMNDHLDHGESYNVIPGLVVTPGTEPPNPGPSNLVDQTFGTPGHGTEGTPGSGLSYNPFETFAPTPQGSESSFDFSKATPIDTSSSIITTTQPMPDAPAAPAPVEVAPPPPPADPGPTMVAGDFGGGDFA